jgi:beta-glucosidase
VRFEPGFAWGVASSAFQSEGGDVPNDWVDAARAGRVPPNPGNGFLERAEADFALVASLGLRHYRLSVEWSRVEPAEGRFDEAALDRYRRLCDAARAAGLVPWVNFFHFTHPSWFAARGGFLAPGGRDAFLRYLERAGRALAGRARHFHVQNESLVYVVGAYLIGEMPPFRRDRDASFAMTRVVLELQAEGYRILKGLDPGATVATIEVYLDVRPRDPADPGHRLFSESFDAWYHGVLLEGLATGWVRLPEQDPFELPALRGALDAYGFNYYTPTLLPPAARAAGGRPDGSGHGRTDGSGHGRTDGSRSGRAETDMGSRSGGAASAPVDAMGRDVDPSGLERGLLRVARALPGVPLLVTENGCPTTDESFRIRYVAAHLAALDRARRAGAPVGGYFHWTAVDNYEWRHGFGDARFGLIGFEPATLERRVKPSGTWLRDVIAANTLDPASIP